MEHYFQPYIWYIIQSSVNIFIFIDFLEVTTYRVAKIKNKEIKYIHFYMHTSNFFVPSRNYSHVHGNVLHAYALQFLLLYNPFPLCITAILLQIKR